MKAPPIAVIGGGVLGLSVALQLKSHGFETALYRKQPLLGSPSAHAGALWYPSHLGQPQLTRPWAIHTLAHFKRKASEPRWGISYTNGVNYFQRPMGLPWWSKYVPVHVVSRRYLPAPYLAAYRMRLPCIEMAFYLTALEKEYLHLGGRIIPTAVHQYGDLPTSLVVHCGGFEAHLLDKKAHLSPSHQWWFESRQKNPSFSLGKCRGEEIQNTIPQSHSTRFYFGRTRPQKTLLMGKEAWQRTTRMARKTVKWEWEHLSGQHIFHCYGHGKSGVTTSWGCARDVRIAISQFVRQQRA